MSHYFIWTVRKARRYRFLFHLKVLKCVQNSFNKVIYNWHFEKDVSLYIFLFVLALTKISVNVLLHSLSSPDESSLVSNSTFWRKNFSFAKLFHLSTEIMFIWSDSVFFKNIYIRMKNIKQPIGKTLISFIYSVPKRL